MKTYLLLLAILLAGVNRASAQSGTYDFDRHTDFGKYKIYKWVNIPGAQHFDDLTSDQLIGTLSVELAKKGLKKSDTDSADLYIGYEVARGREKHPIQFNVGTSYGSAAGANSGTAGATTTTVHSGALILNMYDSETKKVVWQGVV
ncbi:MAG: DUF4136 domain-containing protein, partial [Candidatus Acidiferrum sp.]